jgi:surface carbohydrate biosynthesis protein
MSFEKIINFLKIFIYANYTLSYPKKKKILLFDDNLESFLNRYVPKSKYCVLFSRHKNHNFLIILELICRFKFSHLNYFNKYIEYVKPSIILTFSDNYPIFYRLKAPKYSKKIFAQAAYRTSTFTDIFFHTEKLKKIKKYNKVDEMLVFNKKVGEMYKKFINGNSIVIGSIKSNAFKIDLKKKKFDILFISSWRNLNLNWKLSDTVNWEKIVSTEKKILVNLKNYAKINKRHITVYGKYNSNKEKEYFNNILKGSNWSYLKNDRMKSYKYCDESKLIISTVSTLGYEALSRGSKVVVFNFMNYDRSTISKNFCWPYQVPKNGPFWTSNVSQMSCDKIIDYVSKVSLKKWKNVVNREIGNTIYYDKYNSTLRNLISKFS